VGGAEQKKAKYFSKGKTLYEKGQFAIARLEFKNAIQIDPTFVDAHYMLGMDALHMGNIREAYASFSKAAELQPTNLKAQTELAKILLQGSAFDRAGQKADLVLKSEPSNVSAIFVRASTYITRNEQEKAISFLEDKIAQGVGNPETFLLLSTAYGQKNDTKSVQRVLKQGIDANQKSAGLNIALANALVKAGQQRNAVATWEQVVTLEPEKQTHKAALASVLWDIGEEDKARDLLRRILADDKKNEDGALLVSVFYATKKKDADAERVLLAGIEKNEKSYKLRMAASQIFFKTGRRDQGLKILKEYLSIDRRAFNPGVIVVKMALAQAYFAAREIDEAKKYVDEVVKENSRDLNARLLKGDILLAKGDGAGAVSEFRIVMKERPDFLPAYVKVAEGYAARRDYGPASDVLQDGLKRDPQSAPLMKARAKIWALSKEYEKAETKLRKILELYPNDMEAKTELGDLYTMKKEYTKAEATYEELKRKTANNPSLYVKLGNLFVAQGRSDRALAEFGGALKLNPESPSLLASVVQVYLSQKEFAPAVVLCEARIKKNDKDAVAHNLLGMALWGQSDIKRAEEEFTKASELQPSWSVPLGNVARLYVSQGKTAEATARLVGVVKGNPDNLSAHLLLAQIYSRNKQYSKAVAEYETVLAKQPTNWAASNDLACLLAEHGESKKDLERAKGLAQKALTARPDESSFQDTMGWIYYKQGNIDTAYELITKAHDSLEDNAAISYHLGMVSFKKGNVAQAKEQLKKAILSPGSFEGKEEAEKVLQKIGT
jgi:tetratricopeptide (TPR) repeat protein